MPELPEVEALADHLRRHAVGRTIGRVDVAALSVLKTFDPPINTLHGLTVTGADRGGKSLGRRAGELILITHLSRAGWLRWSDKLAAAPLKPGKGPIALRVPLGRAGGGAGFALRSDPDHPPVASRLAALVGQAGRGAAEARQRPDRVARPPRQARRGAGFRPHRGRHSE